MARPPQNLLSRWSPSRFPDKTRLGDFLTEPLTLSLYHLGKRDQVVGEKEMDGWARLGKPDFSQAARIVYRLPAEIRNRFNKSDQEMLIWTFFLAWKNGFHAGRNTMYTFASQLAWAKKYGKSRWTAARALARLEEYGLIEIKQRLRSKMGDWKPNLVTMAPRMTAFLDALCGKSAKTQPGSKNAPQIVKDYYKSGMSASFQGALSRILGKEEKKDVRIVGPHRQIVFVDP